MTTVSGILRDAKGTALPGVAVTLRYVQACFDREAELTDAIMAADNPESTEIDFSAIGAMAENL